MCGIFGLAISRDYPITGKQVKNQVDLLFRLSETRGKEAAGIALMNEREITVFKRPLRAKKFIQKKDYQQLFQEKNNINCTNKKSIHPVAVIGHSRLVTNGAYEVHENNQPVITSNLVGVHNGIIVNDEELWKTQVKGPRTAEVDSEIIFALIEKYLTIRDDLIWAITSAFKILKGTASIATFVADYNALILYTNNGSLYIATLPGKNFIVFASEKYILQQFQKKFQGNIFPNAVIKKVFPNSGFLIDLNNFNWLSFDWNHTQLTHTPLHRGEKKFIQDICPSTLETKTVTNPVSPEFILPRSFIEEFDRFQRAIEKLRRCTKCLLPETFPFITFNSEGVCNYCTSHRSMKPKPYNQLLEIADRVRKNDGHPDCLVALSGGRDSTYTLHYTVKELNLHPVAYTYDWGMVTDLARRNISRICGALGVEHILVSADIKWKRDNIRKNVIAWLKRPDLGMIPIFMAGDKQYFYYMHKVKKQMGITLTIFGENLLENTDFKTGYCGVEPGSAHEDMVDIFNFKQKFTLFNYYLKQYFVNPHYFNSSLLDSFWAFVCYLGLRTDYINLYRYVQWDEKKIVSTIINEYEWETAEDTDTTWRIGDGTASFYNYIYYTVGGFSEHDTFRSNQIREGMISREYGLAKIHEENRPRYDSIKWYCDTIGLDFESTIQAINRIPKRYSLE